MIAQSGRSTSPSSGSTIGTGASVSRTGSLVRSTNPNSAFTGIGASIPSCFDEVDCFFVVRPRWTSILNSPASSSLVLKRLRTAFACVVASL